MSGERIEADPKVAPSAKAGEVVPPGQPGDTGTPGGAHRLRIEAERKARLLAILREIEKQAWPLPGREATRIVNLVVEAKHLV